MTSRVFEFPQGPFDAVVQPPGDKSLGHRALILSAMAHGTSDVRGLSTGADIRSTAHALDQLGVGIDGSAIDSPGIGGWAAPVGPLDCGNSGTTMRLLTGALAGSSATATLVGDRSLSRRPMRRLVEPLGALGARVEVSPSGTAPITVTGTPLQGASVRLEVASAQLRSAVAFAALSADGDTHIESPAGYRDHTERWLEALGLASRSGDTALTVHPGRVPTLDVAIPGDPSSAAFVWAAAAVRAGSQVTTPGVSLNPGRLGFLRILAAMGADVAVEAREPLLGDPVGDVTVTGRPLQGTTITGAETVAALDEIPLVAIVGAMAEGETVVQDAAELRVKESDRIDASITLAAAVGRVAHPTDNGFVVTEERTTPQGLIDALDDHRVVIAAAIAAIASDRAIEVLGSEAAAVSWPEFEQALEAMWS